MDMDKGLSNLYSSKIKIKLVEAQEKLKLLKAGEAASRLSELKLAIDIIQSHLIHDELN